MISNIKGPIIEAYILKCDFKVFVFLTYIDLQGLFLILRLQGVFIYGAIHIVLSGTGRSSHS